MRTKLTDPRTLLNPAPKEEVKPTTAPTPAPVAVPTPTSAPEPEPERVFDTADNVSISAAADGTIVTEEVAPAPVVEPVQEPAPVVEQVPEQVVEQPVEQVAEEKPAEPEQSFEEQLDQLIVFLDDMSKACRSGIAGVRAMKKRYKEEAKLLKRNAKESEEFVAMKAKLDKAVADKDKAVAQLNKIKSLIAID